MLASLLTWAEHAGELEGLTVTRPTLEDVYLELTEARAVVSRRWIFRSASCGYESPLRLATAHLARRRSSRSSSR